MDPMPPMSGQVDEGKKVDAPTWDASKPDRVSSSGGQEMATWRDMKSADVAVVVVAAEDGHRPRFFTFMFCVG